MIKKILSLLFFVLIITIPIINSQAKYAFTPEEFWDRLNKLTYLNSVEYKAKMTIQYSDGRLEQKIFKAYIEGEDKAFIEVLSPVSDSYTRMLKLGDKVWAYMPNLKKSVLIEGDEIKKPFLNSDLSYEDILANKNIVDLYDVKLIGEGVINKIVNIIKLEVTAKDDSLTYYKKLIKIDRDRQLPWEISCYSRDGKLIKKIRTLEEKLVPPGRIFVVTKYKVQDMTKKNTTTYVELFFVKHNIKINKDYFTKEHLENK